MRRRPRTPPYELFSLVLDYPTEALDALVGPALDGTDEAPGAFGRWWRETPLPERQRRYVETFDQDRHASLNLTYHLYGDTRKRGMALLRLKRLYEAAGLPLDADELPDFLPVLLAFAALAPGGRGEALLVEHRLALEPIRLRLVETESPWAWALEAVCAPLPRLEARERDWLERMMSEGPPGEQVGLEPFAPPEVMPVGTRP